MVGAWALGSPLYQSHPGKLLNFGIFCRGGDNGGCGGDSSDEFPAFLPKEVKRIRDPFARTLAQRIQRLPVQVGFSESCIMSSCVTPTRRSAANPVVLLHCFDSSCLEWRSVYPLLEDAGLEAWAIDLLGWGFSDLECRPPCDVASKRYHLYQLWKSHIKRPMTLVGPSLGAAAAIDFAVNFPEAVDRLVLINANVYAEGTGALTKLPKPIAYAMASLLKSLPIRWYAKVLVFEGISLSTLFDYTEVGRLHCLLPWWEDATVNFMLSGGYNVMGQIKQVKQKVLLISSVDDNIVDNKLAERLLDELPNATMRKVSKCGHMPHVEKPNVIAKLMIDFAQGGMNAAIREAEMQISYFMDDKSCIRDRLCRKGECKKDVISS